MAKKKKKQQGHYCRICGNYKANEKFSGKGHAQHICKSCMSAIRNGKNPEDILPGAIAREPGNNAFQETGQGGKSRIESVCLRSHDRILAGKQTDTVCRKFLRIKKIYHWNF